LIEFHFLTLFPEVFSSILESSLLGKAQKKSLVSYYLTQIRDFAQDKHHSVDDSPYGGGEGMLMKPEVLYAAWRSIVPEGTGMPEGPEPGAKSEGGQGPLKACSTKTILLSPQGQIFNQSLARELATCSKLVLICGHYEGVDQRFIDLCVDHEISIGDYVLTGGELPALVLADTITRLIPGVVGNELSISQDSLERGLLKYPQYTRPREFHGLSVPPVLLSGDHGAVKVWRDQQMRDCTRTKRPDLWKKFNEKA
jgi:tRNA (guanine37-N1)-methyltransferase